MALLTSDYRVGGALCNEGLVCHSNFKKTNLIGQFEVTSNNISLIGQLESVVRARNEFCVLYR